MADVDLKRGAVKEILRSAQVLRDLERRADRIASAAGPGHRVEAEVGRNRARASVITDTFAAMYEEATDRNLTRAIDAGRG